MSRTRHASDVGADVNLVGDDPVTLFRNPKSESSPKGIWLCGGGKMASVLRNEIDRLVVKINPVLLGSGSPLFEPGAAGCRSFTLESSRPFESGVLLATYQAANA